jgi:hypothetical protein
VIKVRNLGWRKSQADSVRRMSKRETLRFAAGSPDEPFSAVWRLVVGKDCFLGCYCIGMG